MDPITNADIRNHALDVVRRHFVKLFLMLLVAALVPSAVLGLLSAIFAPFMPTMTALIMYPERLTSAIPTMILYALLSIILSALVSPAVMLGLYHGMLNLIRGMDASVMDVFSRIGSCLQGFLLTLYVGLRTWLWMLPGLAVMLIGVAIGGGFGGFLIFVGTVAMSVLTIVASFRYAMSLPTLADRPELGVFGSFNRGKEIMNGRKWQLFKLLFVYVLILLAVLLVLSLLTAALAKVPVLLVLLGIIDALACLAVGTVVQVATLTFYGVYADSYSYGY